jgi:hypothetical protein
METFDTDAIYGPARDEDSDVPPGMEAFGPVLVAEPLSPSEIEAPAAEALRRLSLMLRAKQG